MVSCLLMKRQVRLLVLETAVDDETYGEAYGEVCGEVCGEAYGRMLIHRLAAELAVQAPAKLNLFFEVLGKRTDGYHEVETLMCPIDLYDTLYFKEEPSGQTKLECERVSGVSTSRNPGLNGTGFDGTEPTGNQPVELPQGSDNLVVRAIELLRKRTGVTAGVALRLVKRIPLGAGLGGGSSDAAAALIAANEGWNLDLPRGQLAEMAAELGSDVPFFLADGPAICRGRGERVEPVAGVGSFSFVVAYPHTGLSTAEVYAICRPARQPRGVAAMSDAFSSGDVDQVGRLLFNRLQPAAETLSPWVKRLHEKFTREDFLGHAMSGSGTSYFGLCRHAHHARRVARRLEANGVGSVFAVRTCR